MCYVWLYWRPVCQSLVFYCTVLSCVAACCLIFHSNKMPMSTWFPIRAYYHYYYYCYYYYYYNYSLNTVLCCTFNSALHSNSSPLTKTSLSKSAPTVDSSAWDVTLFSANIQISCTYFKHGYKRNYSYFNIQTALRSVFNCNSSKVKIKVDLREFI